MAYDDLRAELIMTTAEGFRLIPITFTIPTPQAYKLLQEELERSYRIRELELQTKIGTLKAEIEILRRPKYSRFRGWKIVHKPKTIA